MLLLLSSQAHDKPRPNAARATITAASIRQELVMAFVMKERWTESDVRALPPGENDWFERKSAQWLSQAQRDGGKPLSAFANSGGGYLIIGIADDGNVEGVAPLVG